MQLRCECGHGWIGTAAVNDFIQSRAVLEVKLGRFDEISAQRRSQVELESKDAQLVRVVCESVELPDGTRFCGLSQARVEREIIGLSNRLIDTPATISAVVVGQR